MVSFHLLRAPYDLSKKTSFPLPHIRGTLSFHVLRAPCGRSVLFLTPNSRNLRGALFVLLPHRRCLFSFQRRLFPDPKLEVPCSRPQKGVVWSLFTCKEGPFCPSQKDVFFLPYNSERRCLFFFHTLRAPRDISPSLLVGDKIVDVVVVVVVVVVVAIIVVGIQTMIEYNSCSSSTSHSNRSSICQRKSRRNFRGTETN